MKKEPLFKNVFVLSTGRTGTLTLTRACQHIKNYSCSHESRSRLLGESRLAYPDCHIEIDNRLVWMLGRLDQKFGRDAFYVHMKRNPEATAKSYFNRRYDNITILPAYQRGILKRLDRANMDTARDMIETVNRNIATFLKDKPNQMEFNLESAEIDMTRLFDFIGADVDEEAALKEFETRHNKNINRSFTQKKTKAVKLFIKYRLLNYRHD